MFYTNLLSLTATDPFDIQRLRTEPPPPEVIDDEEHWEVEQVVSSRKKGKGGKIHHTVKWRGSDQVSEEPWHYLVGSEDLIADFHYNNPAAAGPPTSFKTPPSAWIPNERFVEGIATNARTDLVPPSVSGT